MFVDVIKVFSL